MPRFTLTCFSSFSDRQHAQIQLYSWLKRKHDKEEDVLFSLFQDKAGGKLLVLVCSIFTKKCFRSAGKFAREELHILAMV